MLERVTIPGCKEFPRLYIAHDAADARLAVGRGVPFIRWKGTQDELLRQLLRPTLEKMFPHIRWERVLGPRKAFKTKVCRPLEEQPNPVEYDDVEFNEGMEPHVGAVPDEADEHAGEGWDSEEAGYSGGGVHEGGDNEPIYTEKLSIEQYVGDVTSSVSLEVLQELRLMPKFIGDIVEAIKINIGSGVRWREGYNKRLGVCAGRYDASAQLPNLIILDVSGSIPRGISATMLTLIDTLRTQVDADLIVTSDISRWYDHRSELPTPQSLRNMYGYGNETYGFFNILSTYVRGRHYGHVFSFGDYDRPAYEIARESLDLSGAKVEYVHHYHTARNDKTGYAEWCHMLGDEPLVEYNTEWCSVIVD